MPCRRWHSWGAFRESKISDVNVIVLEAGGDGNATSTILALEVRLLGGSVASPQILQFSGVGNNNNLQAAGITPIIDLLSIGEGLKDHLDTGL